MWTYIGLHYDLQVHKYGEVNSYIYAILVLKYQKHEQRTNDLSTLQTIDFKNRMEIYNMDIGFVEYLRTFGFFYFNNCHWLIMYTAFRLILGKRVLNCTDIK